MRKIREVLRLHSLGLKQRQIARACAIGQSTVSDYIKLAETAALTWAEIADWDEGRLLERLSPDAPPASPQDRGRLPQPDYAGIHTELQKHKHLTLQLVWEEYRTENPEGYRYSRYVVAKIMLRVRDWARGNRRVPLPNPQHKLDERRVLTATPETPLGTEGPVAGTDL